MTQLLRSLMGNLSKDTRGDIAVLFALMSMGMFLVMGAAIDYGRWHHARQQTIAAMDAAVLAGGRALQLDSNDVQGALAAASKYYAENTKSRIPLESDTVTFVTADANTSVTAQGTAFIETTLLKLAGITHMQLVDLSGSDANKASVAMGSNSGVNFEISMMLDITGSMAGSKLTDMKAAATDLVDIVVWDNQSTYTSKVALVPFSQAVNVGGTYFNAITDKTTDSTLVNLDPATQVDPTASPWLNRVFAALRGQSDLSFVQPSHAKSGKKGKGKGGGDDDDNNGGGSSQNYGPCVVDRNGPNAHTDAAPASGSYVDAYDIAKQGNNLTKDTSCKPGSITLLPLSNNKTDLKAKIASFVAAGYTAGHIGTAFTWYMLSPDWSNIWPASSQPAAYNSTNTRKIAILMTDGEYNISYNAASNGTPSEQAVALCSGMKAKGIEVYTVGFALGGNQTATQTLATCATDADHAYVADEGNQLKQAFRDIALKISELRLTQ